MSTLETFLRPVESLETSLALLNIGTPRRPSLIDGVRTVVANTLDRHLTDEQCNEIIDDEEKCKQMLNEINQRRHRTIISQSQLDGYINDCHSYYRQLLKRQDILDEATIFELRACLQTRHVRWYEHKCLPIYVKRRLGVLIGDRTQGVCRFRSVDLYGWACTNGRAWSDQIRQRNHRY